MSQDDWIHLESARNIGEATLVRNLLEHEEIEVDFRGEHRPSIAGELPMPEAMIELWVRKDDEAKAREVLSRMLIGADARPVLCPACGEENPGNFDACWRCHAALHVGKRDRVEENDPRSPTTSESVTPVGQGAVRRGWTTPAVLLFAATTLAGGYFIGRYAIPEGPASSKLYSRWDSDGVCYEEVWRSSGTVYAKHCDANRNGVFELTTQFDVDGRAKAILVDEDESGIVERVTEYGVHGRLAEFIDADEDSIVERVAYFDRTGKLRTELFDHDRTGRAERYIETRDDGLQVIWFDRDEDSIFERREFWRNGQRLRTEEERGVEGFVAVPPDQKP